MKNPFVYGESVTGDNFCDREDEITKLKKDILSSQKIFLISTRRFGKTSLIKTVINDIEKDGVIPIFLDLEEFSSYKDFLDRYLSLLLKQSTPKNKILKFIQQVIPGIRIDFKISDLGQPTISLAYTEPLSTEIDTKIFELPETIAKRQGKKLVVVFDEFQEILKLNRENIEGALRAYIQHQHNVAYIFAGSKRHILNEMVSSSNRPFYKIGPVMHLPKIKKAILLNFIRKRFKNSHKNLSEEVLEEIIEIAQNIPYYVQMLCHELWDYTVANRQINKNDIQRILNQLVSQYSQNFHLDWSRTILSKRQLLKSIALFGGKEILSKRYLLRSNLGLPSSVRRTLISLLEDGYLDRENDEYFFTDILFREWIKFCAKS